MRVLDDAGTQKFLLLAHGSVRIDQESALARHYLHIMISRGLPPCSTLMMTGQYSGLLLRK